MIQTDAGFVLVVDQHESYVTHGLTDATYGDLRHTHALTNNRGHNGTRIIYFGIQVVRHNNNLVHVTAIPRSPDRTMGTACVIQDRVSL